jgi:uncharacterized repeat protein (TIGR03803 family)
MSKLSLWRIISLVCVFCALAVIASPAEIFTIVVSFNGTNGQSPQYETLVQGLNGNLYGTTEGGGANGAGTVFEITPRGKLTTLYSFCSQTNCADGNGPRVSLVQATNGSFYGTTEGGGADNEGTVFEITPRGKLTTLYTFDISGGGYGNANFPGHGPLVQGLNGTFYGTNIVGGANGQGTVFEITPAGKLTTLYSFGSQLGDGNTPVSGLVEATNGSLYGTTLGGGANNNTGTVFKITPGGKLTTLYSFCSESGCTDGYRLYAGLVQATNGNFYGTTLYGGANGQGTVFEITPAGKLTTLHSFCSQTNCADGSYPLGGLFQATSGKLYGTTSGGGGTNAFGTIYSLGVGLGPFVETLPITGKAGTAVKILGNNLTGTISVTFNGTPATFEVVSGTEITTTIPSGATTGKVKVTTPSGTLTSNVNFRVS